MFYATPQWLVILNCVMSQCGLGMGTLQQMAQGSLVAQPLPPLCMQPCVQMECRIHHRHSTSVVHLAVELVTLGLLFVLSRNPMGL